jgi:hypothetical protein
MHNAIQFVLSNPTEGADVEFREWYAGPHMDHTLHTDGIQFGQLFQRTSGPWPSGKHEYLTIWELDDPAATLAALDKVKFTDDMPISPAIDMAGIQPPTMWHRASVRSSARTPVDTTSRGTVVLVLANAADGEDEPFEQSLLSGGLAQLSDQEGVLVAHLFTLASEQIRGNARKYRFGLLLELWNDSALDVLAPLIPALPHIDAERWFAPVFSSFTPRLNAAEFDVRAAQ